MTGLGWRGAVHLGRLTLAEIATGRVVLRGKTPGVTRPAMHSESAGSFDLFAVCHIYLLVIVTLAVTSFNPIMTYLRPDCRDFVKGILHPIQGLRHLAHQRVIRGQSTCHLLVVLH